MSTEAAIAGAFIAACEAELAALKPGNVHVHGAGHRMTVEDFRLSAAAAARPIARRGAPVGVRILGAVEATRAAVGQNTNLGIVLLAAPLAAAAERPAPSTALSDVLAGLTVDDADLAFRAIRLAAPAGLGRSDRHDVRDQARVTLLEAMGATAERDLIARQYATGFSDVLHFGAARLRAARALHWPEAWAMTSVYLGFLARHPDSHIARKHGMAMAHEVLSLGRRLDLALLAAPEPEASTQELLVADAELKANGLNPGTCADLTVASHLAAAILP